MMLQPTKRTLEILEELQNKDISEERKKELIEELKREDSEMRKNSPFA